jgi:hypothetical protein
VPVTNATSAIIPFPAGSTSLNLTQLPSGLTEIRGIHQKQAGSGDEYALIPKRDYLPPLDDTNITFITCWAWMEQVAEFTPTNNDLSLKIDYVKSIIPKITAPTDLIHIINSLNYLGYRTAALAAFYVGENETRAASLDTQAEKEWDKIEGISTKGRQSIAVRRKPFKYKNSDSA